MKRETFDWNDAEQCPRIHRPVGPPSRIQQSSEAREEGRKELDLSSGPIEKIMKNARAIVGRAKRTGFLSLKRETMPINEV